VLGTPLEVAAAVIRRDDDAVLIALRRPDQHQGGLWEFPGGKLRANEAPLPALARELEEELDIRIELDHCRPLARIDHDYPDRRVRLHVSEVFAWTGEPRGCEGQRIAWVAPGELAAYRFPDANLRILQATLLPRICLVTPEPLPGGDAEFLRGLRGCLAAGMRLVQLRMRARPSETRVQLVEDAVAVCHSAGARVLLNLAGDDQDDAVSTRSRACSRFNADGFHLPSSFLQKLPRTPLSRDRDLLVSAACHNPSELRAAEVLGVDFAFLGTVLPSASHPGVAGLGWTGAGALAQNCGLPLFALGGQHAGTVAPALAAGFHGIAAIRGFWDEETGIPDARLRPR
jgi:8-oxo-dGTP diphosphatase